MGAQSTTPGNIFSWFFVNEDVSTYIRITFVQRNVSMAVISKNFHCTPKKYRGETFL